MKLGKTVDELLDELDAHDIAEYWWMSQHWLEPVEYEDKNGNTHRTNRGYEFFADRLI